MTRKDLEPRLVEQVREVLSTPGLHPSVYDLYSEYLATGGQPGAGVLLYPIGIPMYDDRLRADLRYALLALDFIRNDVFLSNLAEMKYDLARAKKVIQEEQQQRPHNT